MSDWVRTALFRLVFYGLSVPIVLLVPVSALFGQRALIGHALVWTRFHRWAARALLGIDTRIEGSPLGTPALYAHQQQFPDTRPAPILPAVQLLFHISGVCYAAE